MKQMSITTLMKSDCLKALNDAKNIHLFLQSMFNANVMNSFVKVMICGLLGSGLSHRKIQPSRETGLKYNVLSAESEVKTLTETRNDESLKLALF